MAGAWFRGGAMVKGEEDIDRPTGRQTWGESSGALYVVSAGDVGLLVQEHSGAEQGEVSVSICKNDYLWVEI